MNWKKFIIETLRLIFGEQKHGSGKYGTCINEFDTSIFSMQIRPAIASSSKDANVLEF